MDEYKNIYEKKYYVDRYSKYINLCKCVIYRNICNDILYLPKQSFMVSHDFSGTKWKTNRKWNVAYILVFVLGGIIYEEKNGWLYYSYVVCTAKIDGCCS